uniref:Subtilisin-like protease SBT1.5 n=1 Tax=Ananas comosus var. bracteatus TaxID=296719 RepID=A0A6V7P3S4_ANACO|nr:unnamed protein product [Ananas comosus var. bracteatus]
MQIVIVNPQSSLVLFVVLFFFFVAPIPINGGVEDDGKRTYIVRVDRDAKPSIFPTHAHWYESAVLAADGSAAGEDGAAAAAVWPPGGPVIHTYSTIFRGFSARLSPAAAAALSSAPGVVSVVPELVRRPDTTRSPQFLGLLPSPPSAILADSDFGSDLVIGVLDTGISPSRRSFSDRGLSAAPARWRGACDSGPGFPAGSCNRKLVGARFFSAGYEATSGPINASAELRSPRDTDGHGTHTASIAAGRYVFPASALGYARGVAAGMAPKARLAAYKVCWDGGCFDSDILAAFDAAVGDGVDVVSLSVGGVVVPYYLDAIAVGAFAAAEAGVFVSASAGNGGPGELTVTNVAPGSPPSAPAPWTATSPPTSSSPTGASSPAIVVCDRGVSPRAAKGEVVRRAGAAGMVLANGAFDGEGLVADCHVLPAAAVGAAAGDALRRYIAASASAAATIRFRGTRLGVRPAPVVAAFSARGPNPQSPDVLKPDVVAPGLNILAAWPDGVGPAGIPADTRRTEFNILSGTSMACPHPRRHQVGPHDHRLHARQPQLHHARRVRRPPRRPFDFGAGHVDPLRAMDPGLVYDAAPADYVHFLCNLNYTRQNIRAITRRPADCAGARRAGHAANLNYPSFAANFVAAAGDRSMSTHFIRTATNVGAGPAVYRAAIRAPEGSTVTVEPRELAFRRPGQKLSFVLRVRAAAPAKNMEPGSSTVRSGALTWRDGRHSVNSPIVITLQAPLD